MLNEVKVKIGIKRKFSDFYRELLLNKSGLYRENLEDEFKFQDTINDSLAEYVVEKKEFQETPSKREEPIIDTKGLKRWPRNSVIAAQAIELANFYCEVDARHQTFISNKTGKLYMEAHHLIPMSKQGDFEFNLDKIANIKCICPNCHRLIHHGKKDERDKALAVLFEKSKQGLKQVKLQISLDRLIDLYN